ncbi:EscF/YscF/HrpA family type III secretion system needle major subunit [Pandoraea terrae]|uniref:EscF/YscF/HrpA family type III secretion system needle major subunit n=1 Tax=Pandoraea terrae TaxID=1537710 RepID=A0A5E4ZFK1_9BURK|nr:type III secretion system needle filament subunit SctF [Pandoraea terrae]VVE59215.1 EscF/YscF/HrpA family type III secretion system needle major subunit [Pandoraea terrae]
MNVEEINDRMSGMVRHASSQAVSAMEQHKTNDTQDMLKMQFALQQYSIVVGTHSAVIKLVKDTLMGIIAKIA